MAAASSHSIPVFADIDLDGARDLIIGGYAGKVWLYMNTQTDEAPAFSGPEYAKLTDGSVIEGADLFDGSNPEVVDWNGNGRPDLLVGRARGVSLYTNATSAAGVVPRFGDAGLLPALDTETNIVYGGSSRTFVKALSYDGTSSNDLLVAKEEATRYISWYKNIGTVAAPVLTNMGPIQKAGGGPLEFDWGPNARYFDWEGDGTNELLAGDIGGIEVYSTTSTPPAWIKMHDVHLDADFSYLCPTPAADITGNGATDWLVGESCGGVFWATNRGGASPGFGHVYAVIAPTSQVVFGRGNQAPRINLWDFNGDGLPDILLDRPGISDQRMYANQGAANDPVFTSFFVRDWVEHFPFEFLQAEHRHFLYSYESVDNAWVLAIHTNIGTFTEPYFSWVDSRPLLSGTNYIRATDFSVADWNSDGQLDLLVFRDQTNYWYQNTNDNFYPNYGEPATLEADGKPIVLADYRDLPCATDLDGDADLDLLIARCQGQIEYYENTNGAPPVLVHQGPLTADGAQIDFGVVNAASLAAGDTDNNGNMDLYVGFKDGTTRHYEVVPEPFLFVNCHLLFVICYLRRCCAGT